jgi:hypothetical protein
MRSLLLLAIYNRKSLVTPSSVMRSLLFLAVLRDPYYYISVLRDPCTASSVAQTLGSHYFLIITRDAANIVFLFQL